jgi:predicted transcriptional regulator
MLAALIADVERRGLTKSQAAKLFGITQPRVSNSPAQRSATMSFLPTAGRARALRSC